MHCHPIRLYGHVSFISPPYSVVRALRLTHFGLICACRLLVPPVSFETLVVRVCGLRKSLGELAAEQELYQELMDARFGALEEKVEKMEARRRTLLDLLL